MAERWVPQSLTIDTINGERMIVLHRYPRMIVACPIMVHQFLVERGRSGALPEPGSAVDCEYWTDGEYEGVRVPAWEGTALAVLDPETFIPHLPGRTVDMDIEAAGLDPDLHLGRLPS